MKIILLLAVLSVGCASPFKPTAFNNRIDLTVIIDDNIGSTKTHKTVGLARRKGNTCTIYVPTIRDLSDERFRVYGKEIAHCIYGDYHKGIIDTY